ncbi:MAG: hypothetical protein HND48_14155 [Chloroflexi bacterium]|nr:hypothetical protein [Chloroflexota bacterium]
MNLVERIAKWVGVDVSSANRPEVVEFKTLMEAARAAKRAERFDEALALFDKAALSAEQPARHTGHERHPPSPCRHLYPDRRFG